MKFWKGLHTCSIHQQQSQLVKIEVNYINVFAWTDLQKVWDRKSWFSLGETWHSTKSVVITLKVTKYVANTLRLYYQDQWV